MSDGIVLVPIGGASFQLLVPEVLREQCDGIVDLVLEPTHSMITAKVGNEVTFRVAEIRREVVDRG